MSMLKVIEVLAESDKGWEDAAQIAVVNASQTVRNIRSIYIKNAEATVENGKIKSIASTPRYPSSLGLDVLLARDWALSE